MQLSAQHQLHATNQHNMQITSSDFAAGARLIGTNIHAIANAHCSMRLSTAKDLCTTKAAFH